jgi:alanyl-tRNA synthetase
VFYATSGGQSHDNGAVSVNNSSYGIIDVIKGPNGQHLHLIDLGNDKVLVNNVCDLEINKQYRDNVSKNHTAEHMLELALNSSIDKSIRQEGAFKTDAYFTFDFKFNRKLTEEEIKSVEKQVNEYINSHSSVVTNLRSYEEALDSGCVGHFTEVYKKIKGKLRVVSLGNFNHEICGGTHVKNTGDIENFMISEYYPKGAGE